MSQEQTRRTHVNSAADDSYWTSLFQLEESLTADDLGNGTAVAGVSPLEFAEQLSTEAPDADDAVSMPPPLADPWETAQLYMAADRMLQLKVIGHNKGGLLVVWNNIQGFVPASQLIDFPQFHVPRERLQALAGWRDRVLTLKIIEVNKANSRLILSERATLVAAEQREVLLHVVRPGEERDGVVTNLTDFGAFVDLGGVEGLIHISEISWSRVVHPSLVLKPGQPVRVKVLSVDQGAERVALSMKRLRPDPWLNVEERYKPGQLVRGVVGNITTYGAFVVLEEELEGLIHISELAEGLFMHPRDVVRSGEQVAARVLSVDGRHKRLALSLRGVAGAVRNAAQP
jgi:small subunit ribosomal protein S1